VSLGQAAAYHPIQAPDADPYPGGGSYIHSGNIRGPITKTNRTLMGRLGGNTSPLNPPLPVDARPIAREVRLIAPLVGELFEGVIDCQRFGPEALLAQGVFLMHNVLNPSSR